jgi:type 2 lantibiotic biosynthesis protein LanM
MLTRTMVLELNIARVKGDSKGETPADRYRDFARRMRDRRTALALMQEYPVLARQLTERAGAWVRTTLDFLDHLCSDWEQIASDFSSGRDPGVLEQVDARLGDPHRGGRSVAIARFSSGLRVVYKPRSLAVEVHFNELLEWANSKLAGPSFRPLRVLNRDDHGWVEFVKRVDCRSLQEVSRFYERQGGLLALLYAIDAIDFHCENVVAVGKHPVLLDLEALFHPVVVQADSHLAEETATQVVNCSVLRTGLLPRTSWFNDEGDGIDVSGLGGPDGQRTPFGLPVPEDSDTDKMHLVRKRVPIPQFQHRPTLEGREVNLLDHARAIARGFRRVYMMILRHRRELLSSSGPLARFQDDEVRVVLRATQTYSRLLSESFHPDVLRDALERDHLFDRLWIQVVDRPQLSRVISAECDDLWSGDIPLLTTRPASRDLQASSGTKICDFFAESSYTRIRYHVEQLDERDLEKQLWFLRASLATLDPVKVRPTKRSCTLPESSNDFDRGRLLAIARAIGNRLEILATRGDRDASWFGVCLNAQGRMVRPSFGTRSLRRSARDRSISGLPRSDHG